MLQIRLLGPVRAENDGHDLPLGGPKPRAVLAVLALGAPRPCSVEHLIDHLYGDDPPPTARNAIQVNVTGLRKALAHSGVTIDRIGDGYALAGPATVDVAQFEAKVSDGRTALRAGDTARAVTSLQEAVLMWGGQPLDGIGAAPFADTSRPRLEATRSTALAELSEAQLRTGACVEAAQTAQLLTDQHPYDERGWIALATATYWAGQQDRALEACRRARHILLEELGVDPTAALSDLETQILNHEVPDRRAQQAAAAAEPRSLPKLPVLPEPFIGREDLVHDVAGRVETEHRLVTLVGIGGIGKTTLALAVAHELTARDQQTAFCQLEIDTDTTAALGRVCRTLGLEPDDDPMQALKDAQPALVLVLDNAEQVTGFGAALDELLGSAAELRAVVTSRRPTGARREHAITVPPLEPSSAEQMFVEHAERVRPGVTVGRPEPVRDLCALLDGIPLALELAAGRVRALTPAQLLTRIKSQRASVLDASTGISVPDRQASLAGVLQEAYGALSASTQRLFALFGSYDGWVSLELLEDSASGWVPEFVDALEELVPCGLVTLDVEGRARMRVPIREFAASKGPRAELDARLVDHAAALVERTAPLLFGDMASKALADLQRDDDTLTAALTLSVKSAHARPAATLALGLNRAWLLTGRVADGRRWIQAVAALPGHGPVHAAQLAVLAGTYASYVNDADTKGMLEEALAQAAAVDMPIDRLLVNGWCCLAAYTAHHGDFAAANEATATAAALAATAGDPTLVALARDIDGHVAAYLGDHERALAVSLAGLADARRAGDTHDIVNLLVNAAGDLLFLGRLDESVTYADEAFDRLASGASGALLGSALLVRGSAHAAGGRHTTARANLVEALRTTRDHYPDPLVSADILYTLGGCLAQSRDDAEACRLIGAAEALYAEQGVDPQERLASPILGLAQELCDRLGADTYATLLALGAADPAGAVERMIGEPVTR